MLKVSKVAVLDKSLNRLRQVRNRRFRGLYEVIPPKLGETKYTMLDNKGRKVGILYRSTSHYTWWKLKRE